MLEMLSRAAVVLVPSILILGALGAGAADDSTLGPPLPPPPPPAAPAAPAPAPSPAAAEITDFKVAVARLDEIDQRLQKLVAEARANPQRRQELQPEGMKLQKEGEEVTLRAAELFPAFHQKNPQDPSIYAGLPLIMRVISQKNQFPRLIEFGEVLSKAGKHQGVSAEIYGLACFAEHDFAKAVQVFEEAEKAGQLSQRGKSFLQTAKTYIPYWDNEQKLREKEKVADDLPRVLLKTSRGEIAIELFENEAPNTVANFISLISAKFYDGIAFHRVIPLFMAQGGDPNTRDADPRNDGMGGPGYQIACECYREDKRLHFAGSLSMAHAGKDTGGSQFFITHLPTDHLNGKHTVFGRVISGLDVARAIQKDDKIVEATVTRARPHPYEPVKAAPKAPPSLPGTPK